MRLVKNGPDLPETLLQDHEDGRMVFFCGSGISYPAGLPDFKGLVEKIYLGLGTTRTAAEDEEFGAGRYDSTIDLLERRHPGHRGAVRRELAKALQPTSKSKAAKRTHRALLDLSCDRSGKVRLVTTNFDRIFEGLLKRRSPAIPTFAAPLVPIPKRSTWDGLVYLHGLLPQLLRDRDLDKLIVSSGDFGLAYLVERWAARFIGELFRRYIVCFVGYSINDRVLRYMMDALAADRMLGETTPRAYAFGGFRTGEEQKAHAEWDAKGVYPLLYEILDADHSAFHLTMAEWAGIYRDGISGKERIIDKYGGITPTSSTEPSDVLGQVLWALCHLDGVPAKRFADMSPTPPFEWLDVFAERTLRHDDLVRLGVMPNATRDEELRFSLLERPSPYTHAPWMALVVPPHQLGSWDDIMIHLARWAAKYVGDPRLLLWVASRGGFIHPIFRRAVEEALSKNVASPALTSLWQFALSGRIGRGAFPFSLFTWRRRLEGAGLTPALRLELRELLSPRVRLRPPIRWRSIEVDPVTRTVSDLVEWEIILTADHVRSTIVDLDNVPLWTAALPDLLDDFTVLLHDALDIMRVLEGADDRHDRSYMHQPSIEAHAQNRGFHEWTILIEILRDAWMAVLAQDPLRARIAVAAWSEIRYPVFRRLILFAASDARAFSPDESLDWLLADDGWWLWSVESQREALQLIRRRAHEWGKKEIQALEELVLQGPPPEMFRQDIAPENLERITDRKTWLLLAKIQHAGARLGEASSLRLTQLSTRYPEWRVADNERDEFPVWMGDFGDVQPRAILPTSRRELAKWLRGNPDVDRWGDDQWAERCGVDFATTAAALIQLASEGHWPVNAWRDAFSAWSVESLAAKSWRRMSRCLTIAPEPFLREVAHSIAWWMASIAKIAIAAPDLFFVVANELLSVIEGEPTEPEADPVGSAINHPVGMVVEAILRLWYQQKPTDGIGLDAHISQLFTRIADVSVPVFRHGRVLLAAHVVNLFRVDPGWTTTHVLPLFNWQSARNEASAAWEGFLWTPSFHRPLMELIRTSFVETSKHYADLGKHADQYAGFLTMLALEGGDALSVNELATATAALPSEGLTAVAHTLVRALDSAGAQRAEYFRNRILAYHKRIWPKHEHLRTQEISLAFAEVCIMSGDAFPEALGELRYWLQPLEQWYFAVHRLAATDLPEKYPAKTLEFLCLIEHQAAWDVPVELPDCLRRIQQADAELAMDPCFVRLTNLIRRRR